MFFSHVYFIVVLRLPHFFLFKIYGMFFAACFAVCGTNIVFGPQAIDALILLLAFKLKNVQKKNLMNLFWSYCSMAHGARK